MTELNVLKILKIIFNRTERICMRILIGNLYGYWGKNVQIKNPCRILGRKYIYLGDNVSILDYARIEAIEQWNDKRYSPKIIIGNNVSIGQGLHLTCANEVEIQDGCEITPYCMITDIDHGYDDIEKSVSKHNLIVNKTLIGRNAFLGTGAKIMAGVKIGEHSIVGANSVVTKDIPDYCVAAGVPARIIKRYNFETESWE
jgi:acetyltransferase-like isoleucine patch superfamily enzyme